MADHRHVVNKFLFTGPDIELPNGTHYHEFQKDKTTFAKDGPGHTHILAGKKTSGPVPLASKKKGAGEMDAKKKTKKKKKSAPKWKY